MKIKRRTPRTDLIFQTIALRARGLNREIAESSEEKFDPFAVEVALEYFFRLSARLDLNGTTFDFELASASDTRDDIRRKFMQYLDTEQAEQVDEAVAMLFKTDAPADETLGPTPPDETKTPPGE